MAIEWAGMIAEGVNRTREPDDRRIRLLGLGQEKGWLTVRDALFDYFTTRAALAKRVQTLAARLTRWAEHHPTRLAFRFATSDGSPNLEAELERAGGEHGVLTVVWRFIELGGLGALRLCPACLTFFADGTKNQTKRWCSLRCKTLVNVARWRRETPGQVYRLWKKKWPAPRISRKLNVPLAKVSALIGRWERRLSAR